MHSLLNLHRVVAAQGLPKQYSGHSVWSIIQRGGLYQGLLVQIFNVAFAATATAFNRFQKIVGLSV